MVPAAGTVNLLVSGAIGLLFIGMGNYLPRVKQNYTLGIKTPWALADPENWRRTQRFGGACFMVLGVGLIVMGVAGSVLSSEVVATVIAVLAFDRPELPTSTRICCGTSLSGLFAKVAEN